MSAGTDRETAMLNDPLFIVVAIACLVVVAILMVGIGGFARGGDFNRKHANRIMRYRIIAQAVAVALILLFVFLRRMGGEG
jgi:hypothetical protein